MQVKGRREKIKGFYEGEGYVQPFLAEFDATFPLSFVQNSIFERRLARGKVGKGFSSEANQRD